MFRKPLGIHLICFPTGKWGFVGTVPTVLAFEYDSLDDVNNAIQCGPGLARKIAERNGRKFGTKVWESREAALAQATQYGFTVSA